MRSVPYANRAATEDNPLALESQVCFGLAVAARRVIALYRPLLEPMGLTHPQYLVMLALWQEEPQSVRRLSELVSLEPATMSPLLKRLEAVGYVRRRRDLNDTRNLNVSLTDSGRRLRQHALQIPPAIMKRLDMEVDDLRRLHAILTDVIDRTQDLENASQDQEKSAL
jgi:MarR family transcriptional regulator, organic hydroperoxide resistance regulator